MEEFRSKLITLCYFPGITWHQVFKILKKDPQLSNITNLNPHFLNEITNNRNFSFENLHDQIFQNYLNGIEVITYFDDNYPPMLKEISQPPWCLFLKGNSSLLSMTGKLAIVGSRQSTSYGKNTLEHILPALVEKKIVIVSGLAKGIDALAHQTALELGGHTIAVIAGGFNHLYPKENQKLACRIMMNNLIISEYPPDTKPIKWQFPARNRIISGLCNGTLLIEAKRKSGSLITANYAVQEGREVFAVPGSIFSPFSEGTNELIQQGAKLVMSGEDIIVEMRL